MQVMSFDNYVIVDSECYFVIVLSLTFIVCHHSSFMSTKNVGLYRNMCMSIATNEIQSSKETLALLITPALNCLPASAFLEPFEIPIQLKAWPNSYHDSLSKVTLSPLCKDIPSTLTDTGFRRFEDPANKGKYVRRRLDCRSALQPQRRRLFAFSHARFRNKTLVSASLYIIFFCWLQPFNTRKQAGLLSSK